MFAMMEKLQRLYRSTLKNSCKTSLFSIIGFSSFLPQGWKYGLYLRRAHVLTKRGPEFYLCLHSQSLTDSHLLPSVGYSISAN